MRMEPTTSWLPGDGANCGATFLEILIPQISTTSENKASRLELKCILQAGAVTVGDAGADVCLRQPQFPKNASGDGSEETIPPSHAVKNPQACDGRFLFSLVGLLRNLELTFGSVRSIC